MRVSIGTDVSSVSSLEQSVMYSGRDRGRGRDFGRRGSFRAERSFTDGKQNAPDKGSRHCKRCGQSNHISKMCWKKFGRPK